MFRTRYWKAAIGHHQLKKGSGQLKPIIHQFRNFREPFLPSIERKQNPTKIICHMF
jgi:hypothetical protein